MNQTGIVSEHEQITSSNPVSNQPEEQKHFVEKVLKLLERAKKFRKRYDGSWRYNYDFAIAGKQWPVERPKWRFNECVNITWATLMTEIGIQTDARPSFDFGAPELSDDAFTDILSDLNEINWDKYNWSGIVQDALLDCKIYDVAHTEVVWDQEADSGLGDVGLVALDPFACFWDPRAYEVNTGPRRCRYFFHAEPVPTAELRMEYPEKKDLIKPDMTDLSKRMSDGGTQTSRIFTDFDPYSPNRLPNSNDREGSLYGGEEVTMLIRCWLRDDTLEEVCQESDEIDPSTGDKKKEYILKKKYPGGRYVEIANKHILFDGPNGVEVDGVWVPLEYDLFPIARCVNYRYPREYAGQNEIEHTKGPQKIANYVWSNIIDQMRMASNPKTVVSDQANIDVEKLTNEPNLIVETSDMNGIRWESGQPISSGAFELLNTAQGLFDKVQGMQDVTRGAQDAAVKSGIMLDGYVEAAQTRPRLKNRNLEMYLQDLGTLVSLFMMQFYRTARVRRLLNPEENPNNPGNYPEYIEFLSKGEGNFLVRRFMSTEDGTMEELLSKEVAVKGLPDVKVSAGSALPYAKAQKTTSALNLFDKAAIDQEEVLKAIDWPNYKEVMKRMEIKAQEQAQAQMMAEQQGQAG